MALYKESDNSEDPALRKQVDASGDKLKAAITPFVENGKAVASSPNDQGLITAWRMSANKLLEIVGEVTRLFAELNMYGYDSLARAAGAQQAAPQPTRHVPIELPPPIPPPPAQVCLSTLLALSMRTFNETLWSSPELSTHSDIYTDISVLNDYQWN